jgi:hypothetical protein
MARYVLVSAVAGAPPNGQYTRYSIGTTIADSASALPGDIVWPALASSPNSAMAPLDAAAAALVAQRTPTNESPWPIYGGPF